MIEQRKLPRGWNRHHTLYYRRHYLSLPDTRQLREHPVMIVPMEMKSHDLLHAKTPPVIKLPSPELTRFVLEWCFLLDDDKSLITPLEGFTSVRDELSVRYHRNSQTETGKEALKFRDHFTRQLWFMDEVPVVGRS